MINQVGTTNSEANILRERKPKHLTVNQLNVLKVVYNLNKGNLTIPAPFSTICDELKSFDRVVVSGELQYF